MNKKGGFLHNSLKLCSRCGQEKPADKYRKDRSKVDGLHPRCADCHHAYYKANREARLEKRRKYVEANRGHINEVKRAQYAANRLNIRCQARAHYAKHREQILTKNKKWRRQSLKGQYMDCRRGALIRNLEFSLSLEDFAVYKRMPCFYCGDPGKVGIDRIDNSKGYVWGNMVSCCFECNRMKGQLTLDQFASRCETVARRLQLKGAEMSNPNQFQQGDVLLRKIDAIPKGAEPASGRVLAEGEATGHKHVAEAQDAALFTHEGALYMRVPSGTRVVHEEHGALDIPPGDYLVGKVREYDHFAEQSRPVFD
jgi:hypothetical protein